MDETKGFNVTFRASVASPDWNFRAAFIMSPKPGAAADDPPKARYFKNLRLLDLNWMGIFNKAMTVKGHQYQPGAAVHFGHYG